MCVCVAHLCVCVCVCVSVSDPLTLSAVCGLDSVMCEMCELEPCLACQSDEEIIRGVTLKSLISLISCHTNNTSFYVRLCPAAKIRVHAEAECTKATTDSASFPVKLSSGVLQQ